MSVEKIQKELIEGLTEAKEIQRKLIGALTSQIASLEKTIVSKDKMIQAYKEAVDKLTG